MCKLRKNYAYNNLRLCTRHFSRDDLIFGCERVILKQGAVPKINVPNSDTPTAKKRKFNQPRYIGEISRIDFKSPRTAGRTIKFIKEKFYERSKDLKKLQQMNRYLQKRIKSFEDLVSHLKNQGLVSQNAADSFMVNTIQVLYVKPGDEM